MPAERTQPASRNTSLPMVQQRAERERLERHKQEAFNAIVGEQVIHALGKPIDLLIVSVRPLWEKHYRVNVFVGPDVTSARVAKSYFLAVDGEGNITASNPKITRQYGTESPARERTIEPTFRCSAPAQGA